LTIRPVRATLLLAIAAASLYLLSFITVLVTSRIDQRGAADAIVVLGAAQYDGRPSPVYRARLDHAADLYTDGLAGRIVVTGAIVSGDRMSEATAGQRYLVTLGVPPDRVVVLAAGYSSAESMDAVAEWAEDEDIEKVILVSDPFHLARLRMEARRVRLDALTSPTGSSPISSRLATELPYLLAEAAKLPVAAARSMIR
jgi:uncharacterized SAM-binding protein YcdF (DUF218 family)